MRVERRVKLPDHSFVVGPKHKLIPSVTVNCAVVDDENMEIGDYKAVKSHGPIMVAVRSNYHSTTSVNTHRNDLIKMIEDTDNAYNMRSNADDKMKPILLLQHDGGCDLQVSNCKNIKSAITMFIKCDLDFYYDTHSAPNMSFINEAERCMATLSYRLSGIVLDHEHYGSHLDANKEVKDEDLCRRNLYRAG